METLRYIGLPFRTFIEKSDIIISVSNISANFIRQFAPEKRIVVIPNGVDTSKFRPRKRKNSKDFTILFVSRIVRRKGLHLLIEAMKYVIRDIPKAKLVVVGEGTFKEYVKRLTNDLHLERNIIFLGKVSDSRLPKIYSEADIFVLPSLYRESFGIVVLEAMASRLPVIVSKVGGLKEIVSNFSDEIILSKVDPFEIYRKIMLLYNNPELRNKVSLNARSKMEKLYDWNIVIKKLKKI